MGLLLKRGPSSPCRIRFHRGTCNSACNAINSNLMTFGLIKLPSAGKGAIPLALG